MKKGFSPYLCQLFALEIRSNGDFQYFLKHEHTITDHKLMELCFNTTIMSLLTTHHSGYQ